MVRDATRITQHPVSCDVVLTKTSSENCKKTCALHGVQNNYQWATHLDIKPDLSRGKHEKNKFYTRKPLQQTTSSLGDGAQKIVCMNPMHKCNIGVPKRTSPMSARQELQETTRAKFLLRESDKTSPMSALQVLQETTKVEVAFPQKRQNLKSGSVCPPQ
jgi:hypothetical protein